MMRKERDRDRERSVRRHKGGILVSDKGRVDVPGGPSLEGAFVSPYVICHMKKLPPVAENNPPGNTDLQQRCFLDGSSA